MMLLGKEVVHKDRLCFALLNGRYPRWQRYSASSWSFALEGKGVRYVGIYRNL